MHITLIGMSGAGKSYLSQRIGQEGYHVIDCDAMIADLLQKREDIDGNSLSDMARWLGLPHEADYAAKERRFQHYEEIIFEEVIEQANLYKRKNQPCLIDTGGSIIYASPHLLEALKNISRVAYLQIPVELQQKLLQDYLDQPRPMIWNDQFQHFPNESLTDTYQRCYPQLVSQREQLYEQYADITLPFSFYRNPETSTSDIISRIFMQEVA